MIKNGFFSLVLLLICCVASFRVAAQQNSGNPTYPFPQNRVYDYGYKATTITSADATEAYNSWKNSFVENCLNGTYRVKFDDQNFTVSEGIGYGMLLAVYHADKPVFDGLWQYYKNARNSHGVMHWKRVGCANTSNGENGATDAELDAAMALIVASCQWSTTSPHNYANDAKALIAIIKEHEIEAGSYVVKPGDMFGGSSLTNPSYFAPAYFRAYAEFTGTDQAFWNNAASKCYQILAGNSHSTTGLVSDWCNGSGTPGGNGYAFGGVRYHYDAARTPWRFATDFLWYGNTDAQAYLQKNVNWVNGSGGGIANIGDSYDRNGTKYSSNHNSTFTGAFANAAMASTQANANSFAQNFKDIPAANDQAYFQRTLRALYYLQLTGNFWFPCSAAPPSSISVSITNPTSSTQLIEGDNITISASATTTSGSISKVEFYYGNTKIGEDNSNPYSIAWNNIPSGKQVIKAVATSSTGETNQATVTVNILKAFLKSTIAPVIDGNAESIWNSHNASGMTNTIQGIISNSADLSASWKALWTDTDVYILANITDNTKKNDSPEIYNDDALELYFDLGNDKSTTYGNNDVQYTIGYDDNTISVSTGGSTTGIVFAQTESSTGYVLEVKIPWSTIKNTSPTVNQLIGFDIHLNDDDDGGERDGKLSWAAIEDEAWQNPSYFGTIILKGSSCTSPGAAGTISGTTAVCSGVTETYSIANVTEATSYTWTVPANAIISSGQGTNTIQVLWGTTSGDISVTPVNNCGNGTISSKAITVSTASTASVSISANNNSICSGTQVIFTATPTNGGTTPTYQWKKNGNNINGATSATYSVSNLVNNDKLTVVMTSNKACVTGSPATSNQVTMNVTAASAASVSISANNSSICSGTQVTFTATPTNGGTTPTYQWKKNGNNINGATSATYSVSNLVNNDKLTVVMTSNKACVTGSPATSNQVTMNVTPASAASVSISANNNSICSGTQVTFTATPTNGGTAPTYQWKKNGNNINGATSATYSANNLANNDKLTVVMTSNKACVTASPATSNQVTMSVTAASAASVSISVNDNSICSGTQVTFTATPTNGGTTPTYQWKKNGNNISGATSATYSASNLANNDKLTVVMTSNKACVTGSPATSNQVTMSVAAATTTANAGSDQYISSSTIQLQGNTLKANETGTWTKVSGSGSIAGTTGTVTGLTAGESRFKWTISNGVCSSSSDIVSVFVGNSPSIPTITGPDQVQKDEIVTYSVPENDGSSYLWTVPDGMIILGGQGTNEITVSVTEGASSGNVSVTETNDFGSTNSSLMLDYLTANLASRKLDVKAFPNPFSNSLNIQLPGQGTYNVKITNINGLDVLEEVVSSSSNIELGNNLKPGVYLLQISNNTAKEVIKVIKLD